MQLTGQNSYSQNFRNHPGEILMAKAK